MYENTCNVCIQLYNMCTITCTNIHVMYVVHVHTCKCIYIIIRTCMKTKRSCHALKKRLQCSIKMTYVSTKIDAASAF